MVAQIHSLPALIREIVGPFEAAIRAALTRDLCLSLRRLFVIGCGDSYYAGLATEWAFEALAGLPTEPMAALQFSRYAVNTLSPGSGVIGISASGGVSRTAEGLRLADQVGARTLALTANPDGLVARAAKHLVRVPPPPFPEPPGTVTPGVRSYLANQLALFLMALHLGQVRGQLAADEAGQIRRELLALADAAERTIELSDGPARGLAHDWIDANEFVFTGGGPNLASALFSAAKVLEASGDSAVGLDTEEWAHVQYFARAVTTPTFILSAAGRDLSRAMEVAIAAKTIRRRVVAVTPAAALRLVATADRTLPFAANVREMFTPALSLIPGAAFAAYRAEAIGEPFFRGFGGGRSIEGGGGISRVRTSETWERIQ